MARTADDVATGAPTGTSSQTVNLSVTANFTLFNDWQADADIDTDTEHIFSVSLDGDRKFLRLSGLRSD